MIPEPKRPNAPTLVDVDSIPDRQCDWGREWDGDYHDGYICRVCGECSDCISCNRDWRASLDCARNVAEKDNRVRDREYRRLLAKYEAQMEYYWEITSDS